MMIRVPPNGLDKTIKDLDVTTFISSPPSSYELYDFIVDYIAIAWSTLRSHLGIAVDDHTSDDVSCRRSAQL